MKVKKKFDKIDIILLIILILIISLVILLFSYAKFYVDSINDIPKRGVEKVKGYILKEN